MANVRISQEVAQAIYNTRSDGLRGKQDKKAIFAKIKRDNNIPNSAKLRINILNKDSDMFLVVRDKRTNRPFDDGKGAEPTLGPVAAPVVVPVAAPVVVPVAAPVAAPKPVAKKAAPKFSPAVTEKLAARKPQALKPAVKAPAKAVVKPAAKTAAKPVAKAAKPAPKAPAKATLGSATKSAKFSIEVRTTIDGKRVRLGYASSEKMKQQMIAAAKA